MNAETKIISLAELASNLRKSAKKASANKKLSLKLQESSHRWHHNTCLDCGVSALEDSTDICAERVSKS